MSLDSLEKLFLDELRDIYNAEKQITRALPRMAKAAESPELQQAFTKHLKETEGQIQRLEQVFKGRPVDLTGKEAEARLDAVGITVNKNAIPYDPEKPFVASGIRVGTPAITTCGMKETETAEVARLIARALKEDSDEARAEIRTQVKALTDRFRPYPDVA